MRLTKRLRGKRPRAKQEPTPKKQPVATEARSSEHETPRWLLQAIDLEGPFGWGQASRPALQELILEHIRSIETMTWAEHGRNGSHLIPVSDLAKDAQRRLEEIRQADVDEVYSLRFGGQKRIIGIRHGAALKVLWWDPEHRVCPSAKKHT